MSVRILTSEGNKLAVMYCSTSDWAFGPLFGADEHGGAEEQALAFLRWLDTYDAPAESLTVRGRTRWPETHDPRNMTDAGLEQAFGVWVNMREAFKELANEST